MTKCNIVLMNNATQTPTHSHTHRAPAGVGKLGGLETKVRQRGPGVEPRWGSGGKATRSRRKTV